MKRLVLAVMMATIAIFGMSAATATAYPPTVPPTTEDGGVSPPAPTTAPPPASTAAPAPTIPGGGLPATGSQGLGATSSIAILLLAGGLSMLVVARVRRRPTA